MIIKNGRTTDCETDNHIPLVVPSVQATEHQTKALDDRKQKRAVGDYEQRVETELPERLQPFMEGLTHGSSSSTDVSPADVAIPPPAIPHSAHLPAKSSSVTAGGKYHLITHFPKTRIAMYAAARKLRERHAGRNPDDRADRILIAERIWSR